MDYIATNQTVTFLPGETCVSVTVDIRDDSINELNETFIGTIKTGASTPDHITIGSPSTAVGTIIDDDSLCKYMANRSSFYFDKLVCCMHAKFYAITSLHRSLLLL